MIEAVPERIEIKQAVFSELDEVTPGHAILASNTSSLSITEMAEATGRPDKVVGFHFFYPGVGDAADRGDRGRGHLAGDPQAAVNFAQAIRKTPIRCGEAPGFVVNRILNSGASELWRFQEESGIDVKELDASERVEGRRRWGRSSWPTCSGSTRSLHVAEYLRECLRRPFYVHRGCGSWSPPASSAPRPERASMSTAS